MHMPDPRPWSAADADDRGACPPGLEAASRFRLAVPAVIGAARRCVAAANGSRPTTLWRSWRRCPIVAGGSFRPLRSSYLGVGLDHACIRPSTRSSTIVTYHFSEGAPAVARGPGRFRA